MQKGFIAPLALAILFVIAGFAGSYFTTSGPDGSPSPSPSSSASPSASPSPTLSPSPQVQRNQVREFTMAGYQNAVKTDKLVVLYYYANWCPICPVSFSKFQVAVAGLDDDRVVAFRVNYSDSDASEEEATAAQTFQVVSHHTMVVVKDGTMVSKVDVSGWDSTQFKAAIEEHIR